MDVEIKWEDFASSPEAKNLITGLKQNRVMNFNKPIPGEMLAADMYNKMNDMFVNANNVANTNIHLLKEYMLQYLPNKVIIDTGEITEEKAIVNGVLNLFIPGDEYIHDIARSVIAHDELIDEKVLYDIVRNYLSEVEIWQN